MVSIFRYSILLVVGATLVAAILTQDKRDLVGEVLQHAGNGLTASSQSSSSRRQMEEYGSAVDGEMIIEDDGRGHYLVDAEVDGREIGFLVDTGATLVTLSEQDAETAGFYVEQLEFKYQTHTASGIAASAIVMIEEIVLGDIVVKNVRGSVIQGYSGISLLGMSFLRKLAGFEIKEDKLILRW